MYKEGDNVCITCSQMKNGNWIVGFVENGKIVESTISVHRLAGDASENAGRRQLSWIISHKLKIPIVQHNII